MSLRIDLFADIVCPWCYIASERLEGVLAALDPSVDVTVVHHPFLLSPSTPPAGTNIPEMLRRKYRRDPKEMFAVTEAAARSSGQELDLSRQPMSYPTTAAHTLALHAGPKGTQRALLRALFRAHFDEARNISDPAVLVAIATEHGFTAEEVVRILADPAELGRTRALAKEASEGGINGVPFFVFDERIAMSGAQSPEVLRQAIDKALALQVSDSSKASVPGSAAP